MQKQCVTKKLIEYYNSNIKLIITADRKKEWTDCWLTKRDLVKRQRRTTTKPSFKTDVNNNTRQGNATDQSYKESNAHMCEEM